MLGPSDTIKGEGSKTRVEVLPIPALRSSELPHPQFSEDGLGCKTECTANVQQLCVTVSTAKLAA